MLRSAFSRFFQPARRRRQQTPAFGFDALESRQLLAGTATVALSNNYDLSITGTLVVMMSPCRSPTQVMC